MKFRQIVILSAATVALAACTYTAQTATPIGAAASVRADRRMPVPVIVSLDPSVETMQAEAVKNGLSCSAHRFPVVIGPAIKSTITAILQDSFSSVSFGQQPQPGSVFLRIQGEGFRPMVAFSENLFSSTASSQAEIALRVSADFNGKVAIPPMTVTGSGSAMGLSGGCDKGAAAASQASEQALSRMAENFSYRVINSGDIQAAVSHQ